MPWQDQCVEYQNALSRPLLNVFNALRNPLFWTFKCFAKFSVLGNYMLCQDQCVLWMFVIPCQDQCVRHKCFVKTSVRNTYALSRPVKQVFIVPKQDQHKHTLVLKRYRNGLHTGLDKTYWLLNKHHSQNFSTPSHVLKYDSWSTFQNKWPDFHYHLG